MYKCKSCGSISSNIFLNFKKSNSVNIKASGSSKLSTNLSICVRCELVSQYPEHDKDYIESLYVSEDDSEFVKYNPSRIKTFEKSLFKLSKIGYITSKDSFLDIGCAGGSFPKAVKNVLNPEIVHGVEPSKFLSKYGKSQYDIKVFNGFLRNVHDQLNKNYSVISLWDVLEHIYDIQETLKIISSLQKINQILIINVPDLDSFPAKFLKKKWPMYLDVHLHYFNKKSLNYLMRENSYQLVDRFNYYQTLPLGYVLKRGLYHLTGINLWNILEKSFNSIEFAYYIGQRCYVFKKK